MALTLVTITGTVHQPDGTAAPAGSTVTFQATAAMRDPGVLLVPDEPATANLDGFGAMPAAFTLYATDDPTVQPAGVEYRMTTRVNGRTGVFYFNLPHTSTTFDLSNAVPGQATPPTQAYATQAALTVETNRAVAAESANATAITAETTRATAAEATKATTTALTAETSRATAAEQANTTAITSEATTARAAETANATAITNETTRATAAEATKATTTALAAEATTARAAEAGISPTKASNAWLALYAASPDTIIAGVITRDANGAATSAPVVWPDGSVGTYTATTVSSAFPGAVDAYTVTYGSPVTKTVTQSAVTRDATSGVVTNRPALTVA